MRERGDRREFDCMENKTANKTPSLGSHDISEWPLHQQTWKGIQLPRNWLNSSVSVHSPCNGQGKALQNSKGQLTNDKNTLSFLMKSFY